MQHSVCFLIFYLKQMEMIKRANNLWTSDSLFSRSSINIPIECSKRVDSVQSIYPYDSTLACHEISLEDNCHQEESEKTKGEKENVFQTSLLPDSERTKHFNNQEESLTDFLLRIDNHIAHSKHSVNTITQSKKEIHTTYSDDDLSKRKTKSSSSYVKRLNSAKVNPFSYSFLTEQDEDLPPTLFINHRRKVQSSLEKLEKEQDEIYQL